MSSEKTWAACRISGTSPRVMRHARPSAMAVLPTPASPTSSGLFLRRRHSTWMVRSISSARPTSGSMRPARACSLRLLANSVRASPFGSPSPPSMRPSPSEDEDGCSPSSPSLAMPWDR
ncbi:hypothetical protein G6F50_015420 [Rhizopus delemar]|uniref:Uncharacterized protein n=1 Tax=Rhizopus delemar TaxID=936053 RepID=A0A9P6XXY0_9FUNG|nr:hypothetical protein G6F50_015420 [Rhizopus delemar]